MKKSVRIANKMLDAEERKKQIHEKAFFSAMDYVERHFKEPRHIDVMGARQIAAQAIGSFIANIEILEME